MSNLAEKRYFPAPLIHHLLYSPPPSSPGCPPLSDLLSLPLLPLSLLLPPYPSLYCCPPLYSYPLPLSLLLPPVSTAMPSLYRTLAPLSTDRCTLLSGLLTISLSHPNARSSLSPPLSHTHKHTQINFSHTYKHGSVSYTQIQLSHTHNYSFLPLFSPPHSSTHHTHKSAETDRDGAKKPNPEPAAGYGGPCLRHRRVVRPPRPQAVGSRAGLFLSGAIRSRGMG